MTLSQLLYFKGFQRLFANLSPIILYAAPRGPLSTAIFISPVLYFLRFLFAKTDNLYALDMIPVFNIAVT